MRKPDKRLTRVSRCLEPHMLAHITSSRGVRWHLPVTLLHNSMSSLQWFAPSEKPSSSDAPSTFWPAQFSNPPLIKPLAPTPVPVPLDPYAFPPERYHSLHPPGYIYYPTTSQAKIYALSNEEDRQDSQIRSRTATAGFTPFRVPCTRCPRNARTFGTPCDGLWRGSMREGKMDN